MGEKGRKGKKDAMVLRREVLWKGGPVAEEERESGFRGTTLEDRLSEKLF